MQKPCQDSYYTLFSSYPTLLKVLQAEAMSILLLNIPSKLWQKYRL